MSIRVEKPQEEGTIRMHQMTVGQMGIVVDATCSHPDWVGHIVKRHGDCFHEFGNNSLVWHFESDPARFWRVRILRPGTRLVVTEQGVALENPEPDGTIPTSELRDGQIAEIVSWPAQIHEGAIIQRQGQHWCWNYVPENPECRVRPLPNGTKLVIENNE